MSDLIDRILGSVPAHTYGLPALLRLVDVVESQETRTAAIQGADQPRMLVNPDFIERFGTTPERLLIVVMHELQHVILGHARLYPSRTALENVVLDAVINAMLCRAFPDPRGIALLTDLYRPDRVPEAILRPPPGWVPDGPAPRNAHLVASGHARLAEVHEALYSPRGVSYNELFEALREVCGEDEASGTLLIGGHDAGSSHLDEQTLAPGLIEGLKGIVSGWPDAAGELARSAREAIFTDLFAPPRPIRSNRARLRDLLSWAGSDGAGRRYRRWGEIPGPITTPLPSGARRDVVLGILGSPFLLHERSIDAPGRVRAGDRVHVYLDVSGSVLGILPALSGAVTDCARFVHPVVHAFSTEVAETTLPDLRKGRIRTTNGTDIRCVADHVRRNRVTRAVIITDGYVGQPMAADRTTLEGIRLAAAWTPQHVTRDLAGLYGRSDILEVQA